MKKSRILLNWGINRQSKKIQLQAFIDSAENIKIALMGEKIAPTDVSFKFMLNALTHEKFSNIIYYYGYASNLILHIDKSLK